MRHYPSNWDSWTYQQKTEWWGIDPEDRRKIILDSYLPMIADQNGNLDLHNLLELILDLQDRVDELECKIQQD